MLILCHLHLLVYTFLEKLTLDSNLKEKQVHINDNLNISIAFSPLQERNYFYSL